MAKRITGTTPRQDGYRMPGEFEEQSGVWMLWPQRPDNWRGGAKPAQQAFIDVARAIARFEPVTVCVNPYWAEKIQISLDIPTLLRMSQLDLARTLTENIVKNGYFQDIATGRNAAFTTGRSSWGLLYLIFA